LHFWAIKPKLFYQFMETLDNNMKQNFLDRYVTLGALMLSAIIVGVGARQAYSANQLETDSQQLSTPVNDTHHVEIYPDVSRSVITGEVQNFSRARIVANDPTKTSYAYNIATRKIEGYELTPEQLPDFLRDKKSLATIHQIACGALKKYTPTTGFIMNDYVTKEIDKRRTSVNYLHHNFCS